MKIEIRHSSRDFTSYRACRVKSLFNAKDGCHFDIDAELDIDDGKWQIGVVVGPSGSGKSSIGNSIFGPAAVIDMYDPKHWDPKKPIVDSVAPKGDFNEVTAAFSAVGLGNVPAWLRPFHVLSNGEKFRAALARVLCERPAQVVIDEFTSVVDRQIARIGAQAFQKSWRRMNPEGKVVLLTPHYDVLDWLEPDWVFDTKDRAFVRGRLRRRPPFELEVRKTNSSYWPHFKPHYYLDLPMPISAEYYVGTIEGELACHLAVSPFFTARRYRATRLVVMPEWQGAGVGVRFLEAVCQQYLEGKGRCGKKYRTLFHTSHPQLAAALRRGKRWVQTRAELHGGAGREPRKGAKYGGHFRAVQGFLYVGGVADA